MKRLLSFMIVLVMVAVQMCVTSVSAAVKDDATDGILAWEGYEWKAECLKDEYLGTSYLSNTEPCTHGWLFVDNENCMNFKGIPSGDKAGRFHKIEIPRTADSELNQIEWGSSFDVEFEMQIDSFGEGFGLQMYDDEMRIYLVFKEYGVIYHANDGYHFVNYALGNDWNTYRCEKKDSLFTLYVNGGALLSYEVPELKTSGEAAVHFYASAADYVAAGFRLRSFEVKRNETPLTMTPDYNAKFNSGEDVILKANVSDGTEYVNYYVGNLLVGTANAETDYAYTLQNLSDGTYNIYAETPTGNKTNIRTISVSSERWAKISCVEEVAFGDGVPVSLADASSSNIDRVDYYANGVLCGSGESAPYEFSVLGLSVGTSSVFGRVFLADGTYIDTDMAFVNVKTENSGQYEIKREYDLSYTFSAENGEVKVNDGYFELSLMHSGDSLMYETRDGVETYSGGKGDFRIIAASGIADVYRNGQLAFSYYMSNSNETSGMIYSGIENVLLGGSGVKTEVFRKKLNGESSVTAEDINSGLFYSLEFDKKDSSHETLVFYDGEFEISLEFKNGIYAKAQVVAEAEISSQKLSDSVNAGYYRLTVYRGLAQLFCDNRFVGSFRAPRNGHKKTLRRVMSNPDETSFVAVKNTDDIYYFEDDFEGTGEHNFLEYWYNIYGNVSTTAENGSMTLSGDGVFLFDATAENPEISWTMTPELTETTTESDNDGCEGDSSSTTTVRSGKFEIGVRYRTELDNVKIKYDHSSGEWSLVETKNGSETTLATKSMALEKGVAKEYELKVENDCLTLKCGGESIFTNVPLSFLGNGKFGFVLEEGTSLNVDNMSYSGNGKVNSGVNYSLWSEDQFSGTIEFYPVADAEIGALKQGKYYSTTDKGATWQGPTNVEFTGSHPLVLQSGKLLVAEDWGGQSHMSLYDADGNEIFTNKVVQASSTDKVADRCALGGRLIQSRKVWGTAADAAPRVFYITSQGSETNGVTTVYYSDDEGQSWNQSKTVMDFENLGNFYGGEADIVDLPDDRIRVYFRTDRSFLCYVDSFDGGVNFSNEPITTQLMTPSTAFAVERDPDQTHTYYMYWSYDVTTATAQYIQYPRNRVALAVSYDGCESWEYILEYDDRGAEWIGAHCNSSMRVFDGIVYVNFGYLGDKGKFSKDFTASQVIMVVDPAEMTTVKRFANAHYVEPDYVSANDHIDGQTVISKNGGTSTIYGVTVPYVGVDNGMVEAYALAKAVGAVLTETDNGVTLTIGDGRVEFTKESAEYKINSETMTAEEICLTADGVYLNPRVCAEIFGKTYRETETVIMLLSDTFSERFTTEIGQHSSGVSGTMRVCIEEFKEVESAEELKAFFEKYKTLLNLSADFTDASYANMFDAYTMLDLTTVNDYETMMAAIEALATAENDRVSQFLVELNRAASECDGDAIGVILTETYVDLLSVSVDLSEISNPKGVFEKMMGLTYNSVEEAERVYLSAYEAQLYAEQGMTNTVAVSTVSRGFVGWNGLSTDSVGGFSTAVTEDENVVTLSAYEGRKKKDKAMVESTIDGVVYQEKGIFGSNISQSGVVVDSQEGTVLFDGRSGNFSITGNASADSYTMSTVFNMKKPEDVLTGTFSTGVKKISIDFENEKTSMGFLPDELREAEVLTYRVDISVDTAVLYAKSAMEDDCKYVCIGEASVSEVTKTKWSVKFETQEGVSEISEIGVYSALSGVALDLDGMTLMDNLYYSSTGSEGHTMTDLLNSGAVRNNVTVNEDGQLVLAKETITNDDGTTTVQKNSEISLNNLLSGGFDRSELDMRVSADAGSRIYLYFADNSGFRYATANFTPGRVNEKSTGYSFSWETGKFYDIKMITDVVGYDHDGQARTQASIYVKKAEDSKWICVAHNKILTSGAKVGRNGIQVTLLNILADKKIVFDEISLKTYNREKGDYGYVNTSADMPKVDYVYSFDYMRMDADTPTEFIIGGEDYGQKFLIEDYRIFTDSTNAVSAGVDVQEDKWYRFFGKVTFTDEQPYANDSSKILKNRISLYMEDEDGNVTTLFENLPMLKSEGHNGLRFAMKDTDYAGVRLKNIRVYNGKALDFVSAVQDGGTAIVTADLLNDDVLMSDDYIAYAGAYENGALCGVDMADVMENVEPYGYKRLELETAVSTGETKETVYKVFVWKKDGTLVPITNSVESN